MFVAAKWRFHPLHRNKAAIAPAESSHLFVPALCRKTDLERELLHLESYMRSRSVHRDDFSPAA
jgi:hypothetical protein